MKALSLILILLTSLAMSASAAPGEQPPAPMNIAVVTAPTAEPVSLTEMRDYLRVDADAGEDLLIRSLITTARQHAELVTGRAIGAQTLRLTLDAFPTSVVLPLPRPPLVSVTSIKYDDQDGAEQTMDAAGYVVDTNGLPGSIYAVDGWPEVSGRPGCARIEYTCGGQPPEPVKLAIRYLVSHWYENRNPVAVGTIAPRMPLAVESLLAPHRIWYRLPA